MNKGKYDLIGDIHGHAEVLLRLLSRTYLGSALLRFERA